MLPSLPPASVTDPVTALTLSQGCQFHASDGYQCPNPSRARGFCATHYKAMKRSGDLLPLTPGPHPSTVPATGENIGYTQRLMARALKKLNRFTPDIVDILMDGMRIASRKGDTSPAQWALLHTGIVKPLTTQATTAAGVTINLGVKVSATETAIGSKVKTTQP